MSKRSYRRLAVVAGAALAVGSMAPAMAARVEANGTADVEVNDASLPPLDSLVPVSLITGLTDTALGTVQDTQGMVLADVDSLLSTDVFGILGDLLPGGSLLSVGVTGNGDAAVNVLGAGVEVNGVLDSATGLAGGVVGAPGAVVGTALGVASPVLGTALGLTGTAVGLATSAPELVFSTASGLLGTGLSLLDGISAGGEVNVLAGLMSSL